MYKYEAKQTLINFLRAPGISITKVSIIVGYILNMFDNFTLNQDN